MNNTEEDICKKYWVLKNIHSEYLLRSKAKNIYFYYKESNDKSIPSLREQNMILKEFAKKGIFKINENDKNYFLPHIFDKIFPKKEDKESFFKPKSIPVQISNEDNFIKTYAKYEKEFDIISQKRNPRYLITMLGDGDFDYNNKRIHFPSKKTLFYHILVILYKYSQKKGDTICLYEYIDSILVKEGRKKITDIGKIRKRINNGILRLYRFGKFPRENTKGEEIIEVKRGEGIVFKNFIIQK